MKSVIAALLASLSASPVEECPPLGLEGEALSSWAEREFPTGEEYDIALRGLVACLGEADPYLRDEVGYTGLATLLRRGEAWPDLLRETQMSLMAMLSAPDPEGVAHPFAILALSEVARTDRIEPWMSPAQRRALAVLAADYMRGITDYRGFDDEEGWRHNVAHTADLMLQLILNEAVADADIQRMLAAIEEQVGTEAHAYIHGEPARLARPVIYAARRGAQPVEGWEIWFAALAHPAPLSSWDDAFSSEAALTRRHNLTGFAQALYITASSVEEPWAKALEAGAFGMLRELP